MKKELKNRLKTVLIIICVFILIFGSFFCVFFSLFPLKYKDIIKSECKKYQIEPTIVFSLINAESGFNKSAKSSKGACGLMQLMPSTAMYVCEELGDEYNENKLFESATNIKYGVYYLNYLLEKFENIDTAICAYNAGETTVKNWLNDERYSSDKTTLKEIPYKETKNYLQKIKTYCKVYQKLV